MPLSLERLPGEAEVRHFVAAEPSVAVVRSGKGKRWYTTEGRTTHLLSSPGMVDVIGQGHTFDHVCWDGTEGEVLSVRLPPPVIERMLQTDAPRLDLSTHHEMFDNQVVRLVETLWGEVESGSPLGAEYAEGLCIALIGVLRVRYGNAVQVTPRGKGQFDYRDRERVRAFIFDQLADDLRVERLANYLSMSTDHFSRLFTATFGQSPHGYILGRRLAAACRALRGEPDSSIAEIAGRYGFASQAHFTDAFRRRLGTTPARWRMGSEALTAA